MAKEFDAKACQLGDMEGGKVMIANEVVAVIAGLAATEVEGVESMEGGITNDLISKIGINNLSKGVSVNVSNNTVAVSLALNIRFGYAIPDVSKKVQERVKSQIESMTGLSVREINVKIEGIEIPQ